MDNLTSFTNSVKKAEKKAAEQAASTAITNLLLLFLYPLFMKMGLDVVRDLWPALAIPVITYWQMFWLRIGAVSIFHIFSK